MPLVQPPNAAAAPSWASDLLAALSAPQSSNNVLKLEGWNACEGNGPGQSGLPINNPFNTTLGGYGGVSVNSAGVKAYPSWQDGLTATVQTLKATRYNGIVSNLQSDGDPSQFASAVGGSGWGTNGACIARSIGQPYTGPSAPGNGGNPAAAAAGGSNFDPSKPVWQINLPLLGSVTLVNAGQARTIKAFSLIGAGALVMVAGGAVVLGAGLGKVTPVGRVAQTVLRAPTGRRGASQRQPAAAPAEEDVESVRRLPPDEGDELFEQTRGSGRANRTGYRRLETSDMQRRTA